MPSQNKHSTAVVTTRRAVLLSAAAVAVTASVRAEQAVSGASKEEQQAIALIGEWVAALLAKDADKAVSYMAENVQYRDDPFQTTLKQGRDQLLKDLKILLRGLTGMKIETAYAIGGRSEVLVLVKRIDTFSLQGKSISTPIAGYYRIQDGKILEWLDTPLQKLPPAPKGDPLKIK